MDNIKKKTRLYIKRMKAHFTNKELDEMSFQIIKTLKNHPWFIKAKTICLYNSLPDEVNTQDLIKELSNSDKKILLPSINASNAMEIHEYSEGIDEIKIGKYRHFKGNEYEVVALAKHSETLEPMVVYRALYGDGGYWVRPAAMWNETVEREGKSFERFTYIGD